MTDRQRFEVGLRKLRHLYEQMVNGHVKPEGIATAATGLLGPAISDIEFAVHLLQHDEGS